MLYYYTAGEGSYGDKTVEDIAKDLLTASQQNLFRFEAPQIVFAFFDGITRTVASKYKAECTVPALHPVHIYVLALKNPCTEVIGYMVFIS